MKNPRHFNDYCYPTAAGAAAVISTLHDGYLLRDPKTRYVYAFSAWFAHAGCIKSYEDLAGALERGCKFTDESAIDLGRMEGGFSDSGLAVARDWIRIQEAESD